VLRLVGSRVAREGPLSDRGGCCQQQEEEEEVEEEEQEQEHEERNFMTRVMSCTVTHEVAKVLPVLVVVVVVALGVRVRLGLAWRR
jgi:hypothetical protein